MKQLFKNTTYLILCLLVFSCNTSKKEKTETTDTSEDVKLQDKQLFSIDTAGVLVHWTAYKFTNKLGVSGKFDDFKFLKIDEAPSIEALLKQSKISIATASVNSNSEIRDPKLRTSFFKVFNTSTIEGSVLEAKQGKGIVNLKMNAMTHPLDYTYAFKNDTLVMTAKIDLNRWHGEAAMQSLNKECYELHTGADGISKLWPDVDVQITLPIKTR